MPRSSDDIPGDGPDSGTDLERWPRPDLGVVRYADEIVVFDPIDRRTHVLGGSAAIVWSAIEAAGTAGAVASLVADLGAAEGDELTPSRIEADAASVIEQLDTLGLLTADA